jgi:aspartyl-tRNA(Asn)/glutamyl-tRNA(Gln) amidotransferase subunit A
MTIAALTRALQAGRTTAHDLIGSALADILQHEARLGAFARVDAAGARAQARAIDEGRAKGVALGPLAGIPVAVAGNFDVAGLGAARDAGAVARLRRAGAVVLGHLAHAEGGWPVPFPPLGAAGRPDNPRHAGHQAGPGSWGAAVAVAAGHVPLALGSDTLGGLRVPAALCGVWALLPTRGLIGQSGMSPLSWTLEQAGLVAGTARDLLGGLAILGGTDPDDPFSHAEPLQPLRRAGLEGLRLGLVEEAGLVPVADPVRKAMAALAERLRGQGASLHPVSVTGWAPPALRDATRLVAGAEAGARCGAEIDKAQGPAAAALRAALAPGRNAPGEKIAAALRRVALARPATLWALAEVEALLMPALPVTAPRHGTALPVALADLAILASATGLPSVTFPLPAADGLPPSAAQLVGPPGSDARLIALAGAMARTGG